MVNVWRNSIRNLKAEQDAAYGEVINGRRKIRPIDNIAKDVSNIPYDLNKPISIEREEGLGNHLVQAKSSPRKNRPDSSSTPKILDTNFGGKPPKNNNAK